MKTAVNLRQKNVGVSFAGGGAKSFAELATLEVLQEKHVRISAVTGTSMGSFLAAGLAYGLSLDELEHLIIKTDAALEASGLFKKRPVWLSLLAVNQGIGLVSSECLAKVIAPLHVLYQDVMLSDLPLPIAIPTVDIITGKVIVFTNRIDYFKNETANQQWEFYEGDVTVLEACLSSSAYPLMIQPLMIDNYQLVDGGLLMNSPVDLFDRNHTEFLVSIGIKRKVYKGPALKSNEVALRAMNFLMSQQIDRSIASADVMLQFELTQSTFSFGQAAEIIAAGRKFVLDHPMDLSQLYEKEKVEPTIYSSQSSFSKLKDRMKTWLLDVSR